MAGQLLRNYCTEKKVLFLLSFFIFYYSFIYLFFLSEAYEPAMFGLLMCVVEIVCLIWQWRDVIFLMAILGLLLCVVEIVCSMGQ